MRSSPCSREGKRSRGDEASLVYWLNGSGNAVELLASLWEPLSHERTVLRLYLQAF